MNITTHKEKPTKSHIDRQNYLTSYATKMKERAQCWNSSKKNLIHVVNPNFHERLSLEISTEKPTGCRQR